MPKLKTAVVTGAAGGIGQTLSLVLAQQGWHLWLLDKNRQGGQDLQKKLQGQGWSCQFVHIDLAKAGPVRTAAARIAKSKPNLLVNNAALASENDIRKRGLALWNRLLAVNLTAPWLLATTIAPWMPRNSSIVNIASTRAIMSEKNTEAYTASKGGLVALTHSLAISLQKKKIRVNAISPGWIHTGKPSRLKKLDHAQHPAGRVGRPQDIAEAVLYLADEKKSGFLTGQNIVIDGGMTKKMIYL